MKSLYRCTERNESGESVGQSGYSIIVSASSEEEALFEASKKRMENFIVQRIFDYVDTETITPPEEPRVDCPPVSRVNASLIEDIVAYFSKLSREQKYQLTIAVLLVSTITLLLILVVSLNNSSSSHVYSHSTAAEQERARRAKSGREDGYLTGQAAGYANAYDSTFSESYDQAVTKTKLTGEQRRLFHYVAVTLLCFFLIGFVLQWLLTYLPRRLGLLNDIDYIVLPVELSEIEQTSTSKGVKSLWNDPGPPSAAATTLVVLMLFITGCAGRVKDSTQQAYDANHKVAYQEGWNEGSPRGTVLGREQGSVEGTNDAKSGKAWQLYRTHALFSLLAGITVGVILQYSILVTCRNNERLPGPLSVAVVPAMKRSLAYSFFEKRRQLQLLLEEQLDKLDVSKRAEIAEIRTLHAIMESRIKATRSIEEVTNAQFLDIAKMELDRIIESAEKSKDQTDNPLSFRSDKFMIYIKCSRCLKEVLCKSTTGGKTVNCPHSDCGNLIDIPRVVRS